MKKVIRILIICCGIIVTITPALYSMVVFIDHLGLPIKINADGSTAYLFMDVSGPMGKPLPMWFMLLWGFVGLFIIIVGIKASKIGKKRKMDV